MSFKSENYPANDKRVIFALWHHDQLCLDGIPNRDKLNILISKSIDGEIIAKVVERMGFKTVRGSYNRAGKDKGGKEATFELITRLNNSESKPKITIIIDITTENLGFLMKKYKSFLSIAILNPFYLNI